ncbi:MAG: carboxypeptidase-like regulatory domain-containing protein [Acidobacteriota bacterium]
MAFRRLAWLIVLGLVLTTSTTDAEANRNMEPTWTITGHVIDVDGRDVSGLPVHLDSLLDQDVTSTHTDRDGRYRFEVTTTTLARIRIGPRVIGPFPVVRSVEPPPLIRGHAPIDNSVLPWRPLTTPNPRTAPTSRYGRLTDAMTGAPIPGAIVWSSTAHTTTTDAQGHFSITSVDVRIEAAAVGYFWDRMTLADDDSPIEIVLKPVLEGQGEVRRLDETPIANAVVDITLETDDVVDTALGFAATPQRVRTDDTGRFRVAGLAPGRISLDARADGFADFHLAGIVIESPTSPGTIDLGVVLLDHGRTWRGRLVDTDGHPLVDVPARFRIANEETWQPITDGVIELRDLSNQDVVSLAVDADGYRPKTFPVTVREDDTMHDLVLSPGISVEGQVIDPTGVPVFATVEVLDGVIDSGTFDTTIDGRFTLDTSPGPVTLVAHSPGFGPSTPTTHWLDTSNQAIELELRPGCSVTGRVLDSKGARLPEAIVLLERTTGPLTRHTTTDAEGNFRVDSWLEGETRIRVMHREAGMLERDFDLEGSMLLELVYPSGHTLEGSVVDARGKAVADARIQLSRDTERRQTTTDASGQFRFEGVAVGSHRLHAEAEGFATSSLTTVRVDDHPPPRIDITLDRGATLEVRVSGLDETLLGHIDLMATDGQGRRAFTRTNYLGEATLGPVAQGHWTIRATLDRGRRSATAIATVPASNIDNRIPVEIHFTSGATLRGRMVDGPLPVAGANLLLIPAQGRSIPAQSAADGGFVIADLEPGAYRLEIRARQPWIDTVHELWIDGDTHWVMDLAHTD